MTVTIVQDAAAKKEALPFSKYGELPSAVSVEWVDMADAAAVEAACTVDGLTHVYDNIAKSPADAAPVMAAAKKSDAFKTYAFVSSAGMYSAKGILKETNKVKDPPTGQREVEMALEAGLPGKWCAFRPQYIYGPCTDKMCSYDDVCIAAAQALGKEALVAALPPDTKSSFPFRPNAEGFAVRVRKAKDVLGWAGATHNVLDDIAADGFYTKDYLALGLDKGDLDTSKDGLELCENLEQDYGKRGVHV